jgi:MoxR-like ATPase
MTATPESPTPPPAAAPPGAPPHAPPAEKDFARAADLVGRIRTEIAKAVVAQEEVVEQLLVAFLAGGHVLIEGVPGLGKTLIALSLARTFGGSFRRIQFTPDLMPADVTGHTLFDERSREFRIRKGPAFTNLLLADEINRAPAKTQAALLEVMQEHQITIEGRAFPLPPPFMTLANQNPIEQEGTYPLPEAQVDRFLLKVVIDYPSEAEEVELVERVTLGSLGDQLDVSRVGVVAAPEDVLAAQRAVAALTLDRRIVEYAVAIARATRAWKGLRVGVGPRGAIALVRAARARALLAGRDFVTPDDVKALSVPALVHRVILAPELEIEGYRAEQVVRDIVERVEAPRA